MDIPLNAPVKCKDGLCGRSSCVLVDPKLGHVTHLVVKAGSSSGKEYLVPVKDLSSTLATGIELRLTRKELQGMLPFVEDRVIYEEVHRVPFEFSGQSYGWGASYYMPYVAYEVDGPRQVQYFHIPSGELAIRQGARVIAIDGFVGHIEEFVVDSLGCITHVILQENNGLGHRDVVIPLSAMDGASLDTVSLNLTRKQIGDLPTITLHQRSA